MTARRVWTLLCLVTFGLSGGVAAQDGLVAMRDLLQRGFWHSAAQLHGPNLVAQLPDSGEAHLLFAQALYLTGDAAGAAARLEVAGGLLDEPLPTGFLHLAALVRADQGDPVGAAHDLRAVFEREPSYTLAMDWGRVAWQAGLLEDAESAFRAAAAANEGAREAWPRVALGRVLAAQERWTQALASYRDALDVYEAHDPGGPRLPSPVYVEAWYRSGEAFEALGSLADAEAAYRAARSVDANHAPSVQAVDRLTRRGE